MRYAQMSRKERAICAAEMYAWKLKSWARAAGCFDDIDWALSARVLHMYYRLLDNEYALKLLGDVFVPADRNGVFRPWSRGGAQPGPGGCDLDIGCVAGPADDDPLPVIEADTVPPLREAFALQAMRRRRTANGQSGTPAVLRTVTL